MKKNSNTQQWTWWKHGTIYQIYPRSFKDTTGNGIGDINGITRKLDYLKDLGIDAIWLSPINTSPMYDHGYDISDYRGIDPLFGTKHDFLTLIKQAHNKNIKIIMDLVINHSSYLHPWFLSSRSSRTSTRRDWYIWHDGKNGGPPNNWKSALGSCAWEWDEHTHSYYLHSFLTEQPDLNWRNEQLKAAVFSDIQYWIDQGVDGFRIDVVNWLVKDKYFRNNHASLNPFHPGRFKYMRNRPEVHDLLREFRSLLDQYDDLTSVGEVFTFPPGNPELSARFLGNGTDQLHMAFDFSLLYTRWGARKFYKTIKRWLGKIPEDGWPCHVLSNHDQPRSFSRLGWGGDAYKRAFVAATFLLTIKGTPFIYYGEEIGMSNGIISKNDIVDPLGKRYWPIYTGRDKARTPMQWNSKKNAGFSKATPWLPINPYYTTVNVAARQDDTYSLFNFYKKLISLRKRVPALHKGEWVPLNHAYNGILCYAREYGTQQCVIALNFTSRAKELSLHNRGQWKVLLSTHKSPNAHFTDLNFQLAPDEATILEKIGNL